ncbi:MAG TPA: universal stress protein, partial [Bacteroidota bacterium]
MAKKQTRKIRQPAPSRRRNRVSVNHILLPFDFSIHSKNALRYAVLMAKEFDASLHLVYVVEPTLYPADLGFGQVV